MLALTSIGIEAYDLRTKVGAFAGLAVKQRAGHWRFYKNTTATRYSARKFPSIEALLDFVIDRRAKRAAKRADRNATA